MQNLCEEMERSLQLLPVVQSHSGRPECPDEYLLGYRKQFVEVAPEISEMLHRQDVFSPIYREKITNENLMKILNFENVSPLVPLSLEERRIIVNNMRCSLCNCVPPPMPKHCRFGHWICKYCDGKVPYCPYEIYGSDSEVICKELVTLSWDMEKYTKIYNKLKVPCKNCKLGCNAKIRTTRIKNHAKRCPKRQAKC